GVGVGCRWHQGSLASGMRLRLPAALALPAATKGDFGPSRSQGRRAVRLHHCDASAQGSQRWIFRFRRAAPASFWRRPVLATLAAMRAGKRWQRKRAKQQQEATKESMSDPRSELTVSLWRGAQEGRYETYKVPWRDNQTVLDVVTFVQRHLDPTLSYRFACRVGMCGSCAMTVNGTPRWTCRTHVSSVAKGGRLEIGPLENLPVIKDLAADMRPFFDKWQRAKGAFVPSQTRGDEIERIRPDSAARIATDAAIECINCGICYAACDTVRWNSDYLGPAALNRAWTLVNDVRDGGNAERLQAVPAFRPPLATRPSPAKTSVGTASLHRPRSRVSSAAPCGLTSRARYERSSLRLAAADRSPHGAAGAGARRRHLLCEPQRNDRCRYSRTHARQHRLGVVLRRLRRCGGHPCGDRRAQRADRMVAARGPQRQRACGHFRIAAARARRARGRRGGAAMTAPRLHHRQSVLWIAALVHRLSGLALAIFLPLHF